MLKPSQPPSSQAQLTDYGKQGEFEKHEYNSTRGNLDLDDRDPPHSVTPHEKRSIRGGQSKVFQDNKGPTLKVI